jgi:peptidoglycan/LPS O-acetylase OafA/YrhL
VTTALITLATTHAASHSEIPSPVTILLVVAAVGYVLWSRMQGRPLKLRRMLLLPVVLVVLGIVDLTGSSAPHLTSKDIAFLVVSLALSIVLGAARGATIELYPKQGELWQRYRKSTVALWIALIAAKLILIAIASAAGASAGSGTSTLLLTLGVSLLAEAAIVVPRALSTGLPFATGHQDSDDGRSRPSVTTRAAAMAPPQERHASRPVDDVGPADDDYRRHDHHHHDHHHNHHGLTGPS